MKAEAIIVMLIKANVVNGLIHLIQNFRRLCFHMPLTLVLGTAHFFSSN